MKGALQWTPRRAQVRELILMGMARTVIADVLAVSPATARQHVAHVLEIEGVSSMRELQALEIERLRGQVELMQWRRRAGWCTTLFSTTSRS